MDWDDHADGWDENAAVRAYSEAAYHSLLRFESEGMLHLSGARVLDFGCGTGLLSEKMAKHAREIIAIDTSKTMISILEAKKEKQQMQNVRAISDSIDVALREESDLRSGSFDLVTCSSVCAFLDDYPATVGILSGLLSAGGAFVQWDWELDPASEEPFGLTRRQIRDALAAAELHVVLVEVAFDVEFEGEHMRPLLGFGIR